MNDPLSLFCFQIVGERLYLSEEHKNKFLTLLKDNFYVPVLRAENNCSEPVIGEPFSPTSPPVS